MLEQRTPTIRQKTMITVATFLYPHLAAVPAALLESHGIHTYIKNEVAASTSYNYVAAGGVKLQVEQADVPKAKALLLQGGFLSVDDMFPSKTEKFLQRIFTFLGFIK